MNPTEPKHPDEPAERLPPPQPMPPAPDLHLLGTPIDPLGLPDRPHTTRPVRIEERSSTRAQLGWIALILLIVLGFALLVWLAS